VRSRHIATAAGLSALLVFGAPAVAGAAESVGSCIVHEFEELEAAGLTGAALEAAMESAAESCIQAPNPILPPWNEIIWGLLSFIVLFALLTKFALPPVRKAMEARTERIRNDLMAAEQARVEAENIQRQYESQLADARAESQRIIEDARRGADALKADLQARAEADIVDLRARAQADVEASRLQALADLRNDVANIALSAAEQVVERSLDRETQLQLIESYINQVGSGR
jgi:F-type H+-transporting ATPase subunit b